MTDYEFLELYNTGATTLNLAGYTFNNGIAFTFPIGAQIAPGGYVLIAKNAAMYGGAGCPFTNGQVAVWTMQASWCVW
ncbi:MAG: lamin tail domain-containing protein [Chloroflexi bacterium]|nr:lamin tail domain-containing protein [Chloroflexota bacterium]